MSDDESNPTMARMLSLVMDRRLEEVHTAMPGVVTAYDATTQQCSVQPSISLAYEDETGQRVVEEPPVITNVPVAFQRGGGFRFTFPLVAGDTVLLVFSMRSIDRWQTKGGVVDPGDDRRFHLSDAIAIPGVGKAGALVGLPDDHAAIGHADTEIHMYSTGVSLGAAWDGAVALAKAAQTEARLTALENHRHYCSTGTGSKPLTMSAAYTAEYPSDTGSAQIPNPPHGDPFHVHGDPPDAPAPTYITDPLPAGSAVATTKVRGI